MFLCLYIIGYFTNNILTIYTFFLFFSKVLPSTIELKVGILQFMEPLGWSSCFKIDSSMVGMWPPAPIFNFLGIIAAAAVR